MRYIPSVVPTGAQNATASVLRDEMARRLSKLRTMADWSAMLEELSASRGNALPAISYPLTEVVFEINRRHTGALSLSMGSLLQLASRRS